MNKTLAKNWQYDMDEVATFLQVKEKDISSREDLLSMVNKLVQFPTFQKESMENVFNKTSLATLVAVIEKNDIKCLTQYYKWWLETDNRLGLPKGILKAYKMESFDELTGVKSNYGFSDQKKWIQENTKLKSSMEFGTWASEDKPIFINSRPDRKFTDEWKGCDDFLGVSR